MIVQDNPEASVYDSLREPLLALRPADHPTIDRRSKTFAILDHDQAETLRGGVYAYAHPGWVYVDLLWVAASQRKTGLGSALMHRVEDEARRRACHGIYLWTQDFEAPGFYEKLGYTRFVTLEDFIPGHQRIGFMKRLAA